jgi:methionine sulfoxide reductase heme-binding subunit
MRPPWRDRRGRVSGLRCATLAAVALPAVWMIYDWRSGAFGPLPLIGLVYWSGIWATLLLLLTLAVTPARRILHMAALADIRRIVGVSALFYTVAHTVAFLALYRWDAPAILKQLGRPSLVVATVSLAGLAALGATSFDAAVRQLGGENWRRLHWLNYALTALAVIHFLLSPGIFGAQYTFLGLLLWLFLWRVLARRGSAGRPASLFGLAVAVTVLVLCAQIVWLWVYQDVPPADTMAEVLTFEEEVPPPWQVLAIGLLAALLACLAPLRSGPGGPAA